MRSMPSTASLPTFLLLTALIPGAASPVQQAWQPDLPDVSGYPRPVPVTTVPLAAEVPRLRLDSSFLEAREALANEAVRIRVLGATTQQDLFGESAPEGRTFLVLSTEWENIHPREKVNRASLEGRADRTMGVGAFSGGGGPAPEYVEVDVAYQVPRLADHVYALTDGGAVSLHPSTATLPGGRDPDGDLVLPLLGSRASVNLAFLVPEAPEDVALQFFDYSYGNVLVPVRGDPEDAAGESASGRGEVLDRAETDVLEVAATGLTFGSEYRGVAAPDGWRYALVTLRGQSRSTGGSVSNIVQLDPTEYAFVVTDGGYLRYARGGSVDDQGVIRFTPEVPQRQELAFLLPEEDEHLTLGLRLRNEVVTLRLTDDPPTDMPGRPEARHQDGDVMEVLLFGARQEGDRWVADFGVRSLREGQGLEIRAGAQFLLVTEGRESPPNMAASSEGPRSPPDPFVIPPGMSVRFQLVFPGGPSAEGIRFRGFRSEGLLRF